MSYASTYPEFDEALSATLTNEGKQILAQVGNACILDGTRALPQPFESYTTDGRTLAQIARDDDRILKYLNHNKLGQAPVSAPIMVLTNPDDDLVPEPQATQLAADYCALGSPVEYRKVTVPGTATMPLYTKADLSSALIVSNTPTAGHATPLLLETRHAAAWMDDRFEGKPLTRTCPGDTGTTVLNPDDADTPDVEIRLNQVEIAAIVLGTITAITGLALGGAYQAFTHGWLDPYLDPRLKDWLTAVLP
ncbi:hypothetical protein JKI95_08550 [Corynebacterium aquatimens]|uniref:lipase family protein n=1 Tax=Corynebacterium aquatimens TaxID=1190508 RepID=UPI0025414171|nr:lipase family protein [Corynebacterium aquatimens]QYH19242.1 hypothetical protein JKI95_08550 [Corynebacterium aquatimens]